MKKIIAAFAAAVVVCSIIITIINLESVQVKKISTSVALGSSEEARFNNANTQTGVLVGTSSTLILATSTARQFVYLVNDNASTTIYLSMNKGAPALLYSGIALKAGSSFMINTTNGYIGAIYGVATQIATTTVYEK